MTPEQEFGDRVRRMRLRRRWTLDGLAERSGVSRATISKIERGERSTRLGSVVRIAEAFGVQLGQLVDPPAGPPRVLHRAATPGREHSATSVSREVLAGVDTGVELLRYELPCYSTPAVLAAQEPGTRQVVVLLTGEVLIGSGDELVELAVGDVVLMSEQREQPLHNIGTGCAVLLSIISRTPVD